MARGFIRKPSINKVLGAYRSQWKRALKRFFFPWYGKKGMGWWNNPRKAAYSWWYYRTSISLPQLFGLKSSRGASLLFGLLAAFFSFGSSSGSSSKTSSGSSTRSSSAVSSKAASGSSSAPSTATSSTSKPKSTVKKKTTTRSTPKTATSTTTPKNSSVSAPAPKKATPSPAKKVAPTPAKKSVPDTSVPTAFVPTEVTKPSAGPTVRRNKTVPLGAPLPAVAASLTPGAELTFVVAPDKVHGSNAVAICYRGEKIGYAAKQDFFVLASHLRLKRPVLGRAISLSHENGLPVVEYEAQLY